MWCRHLEAAPRSGLCPSVLEGCPLLALLLPAARPHLSARLSWRTAVFFSSYFNVFIPYLTSTPYVSWTNCSQRRLHCMFILVSLGWLSPVMGDQC